MESTSAWAGAPPSRANVMGCHVRSLRSPLALAIGSMSLKLLFLGGAGERRRGREAAADHLRHVVEVAGAYLALMLGGGVALRLERELTLLQLGIGRHATVTISQRQLENTQLLRIGARECGEQKIVAHSAELPLGPGNFFRIQLFWAVEQ